MKKILFLNLLTLIMLFSCTKETHIDEKLSTKSSIDAKALNDTYFISEQQAREFIAKVYKETDIKGISTVSSNGSPTMYIINFDEGWKIVSADKRMPPILAFSNTGYFDDTWTDNPGTKMWVGTLNGLCATIRAKNESSNKNTEIWDTKTYSADLKKSVSIKKSSPHGMWTKIKISETSNESQTMLYGPYTETTWGQDAPWNNNFPVDQLSVEEPKLSYILQNHTQTSNGKYNTGCVAVALSQLFYYYHFKYGHPSGQYASISVSAQSPAGIIAVYSNGLDTIYVRGKHISLNRNNYEEPSPRWSMMAKSKTSGGNTSYVSDLMLDVGNRANISYSSYFGSGGTVQDAFNALQYYGLQASMGNFQKDSIIYNLMQERPVFAGGYNYEGYGHAWVIDGYYKSTITKRIKYRWLLGYNAQEGIGEPATYEEALEAAESMGMDKPEDPMETEQTIQTIYDFYNMNYGWDGDRNGFYLMVYPGLDINIPYLQYQYNVLTIYNIAPIQ